jgi:chemotaxis protein CheZ
MAVQRKIFRMEESLRSRTADSTVAVSPDDAASHDAFMSELRALRSLIEPREGSNRDAMDRVRAQIAEAQAYKSELAVIHAAIARSREDMALLGAETANGEQGARVSREFDAIVSGTERATNAILQAAEKMDHAAGTLAAALKGAHENGLVRDIQERVLQIFEACNFQDLIGQRVDQVMVMLKSIEDRTARLLRIWRDVEQVAPETAGGAGEGNDRLLNGPKLAGDRGHFEQSDIDGVFRCA